MGEVFGLSGRALMERVGALQQVVSAEQFTASDGPGAGTRVVRLVNGGGLEVEVHPDRALDIGRVTYAGVPFAWLTPTGFADGGRYEPEETGWLRTFGGGLLATCGLDAFGPPSTDAGQSFGLHGRIGTTPARLTAVSAGPDEVVAAGTAAQGCLYGEDLLLDRRISSPVGSNELVVEDTVTNLGFGDQPHMILYHLNFGWPLLDDGTRLQTSGLPLAYNDAAKAAGLDGHDAYGPPAPGYTEQIYRHDLAAPPGGDPAAVLANPARGLAVRIWLDASLPFIFQWKMRGQRAYVTGIEPANCAVMGRSPAVEAGAAPVLAPGESVTHRVRLEFVVNP